MKSFTRNLLFFCVLFLILILGFLIGTRYSEDRNGNGVISFGLGKNTKVSKILNLIRKNYVDSVKVDSMENLAINEILKNLDPHSLYLPPQQAKEQSENLEGNFEGIGIEYYLLSDTIFVVNVRPDGPSEKAGILRGDKIVGVNGEFFKGKGYLANNIINKLKGKKGSKVLVSVLRDTNSVLKNIEIVRDKIIVSSIDVAYLVNNSTGYIKISKFGASTDEDFEEELNKLNSKGMKNLILDLRGNGGGYLNSATALADQFLEAGKLIVYTKGLHEPRTDYSATADGLFEKGALFILIDEGTASASEVLAGAVQDLDRGLIIGRRSFGKGLVQEQFSFEDGSAINLTVARYYTPSGRSIQKSYQNGTEDYKKELKNRYIKGEYTSLDSVNTDSVFLKGSEKYKTEKGRVVFGGGGIMPDYFIPIDTSYYSNFYRKVNELGLIQEFVYRNLIQDKALLSFRDKDDFSSRFKFSDETLKQFIALAASKKIAIHKNELEISLPKIKKEMKAILARYLYNEEGFYQILNQHEAAVIKVLDIIKNPN